jgi:hypothetical protein
MSTEYKGKRVYLKHTEHAHPQTKHARTKCRRIFEATGKPWDGTEPKYEEMTRGEKSAATRRRNEALAEQAAGVDSLLAAESGVPDSQSSESELRDSHGRFTKATLASWSTLLSHLEGAQDFIAHNGIELTGAMLTTSVGGHRFVAEFDGDEWVVTAEPNEGT